MRLYQKPRLEPRVLHVAVVPHKQRIPVRRSVILQIKTDDILIIRLQKIPVITHIYDPEQLVRTVTFISDIQML